MEVQRNHNGPRGFAMAISGMKSPHDVFNCPKRDNLWHKQVVTLRVEARETASRKLRDMLLDEADEILQTKHPSLGRFTERGA